MKGPGASSMGTSEASEGDMLSCSRYSNSPCACGRPSKYSREAALSSMRPVVLGALNCRSMRTQIEADVALDRCRPVLCALAVLAALKRDCMPAHDGTTGL
jgi:hypothetical protein